MWQYGLIASQDHTLTDAMKPDGRQDMREMNGGMRGVEGTDESG